MENNKILFLLLAVVFIGITVDGGLKSYKELEKKTQLQNSVNIGIEKWKQSYKALSGVSEEFEKKYPSSDRIPDIRAIINLINLNQYGLEAKTDNLILVSVDAVKNNNVDLALTKICLGVASDSLIVESPSYNSLMKGLKSLSERQDMYMGSVSIQGNLVKSQAKIGQFCIYTRNGK